MAGLSNRKWPASGPQVPPHLSWYLVPEMFCKYLISITKQQFLRIAKGVFSLISLLRRGGGYWAGPCRY
jgi:hypothetical protein